MFLRAATSILFIFLLISIGCSGVSGEEELNFVSIGYAEAVNMIAADRPPVIFDVRTPAEFNNELGHIPGARLLPMQVVKDSLEVFGQLDDRNILLVCRSGRRSGLVAKELVEAGVKRVYNLEGGLINWHQHGGEIAREFGQ